MNDPNPEKPGNAKALDNIVQKSPVKKEGDDVIEKAKQGVSNKGFAGCL